MTDTPPSSFNPCSSCDSVTLTHGVLSRWLNDALDRNDRTRVDWLLQFFGLLVPQPNGHYAGCAYANADPNVTPYLSPWSPSDSAAYVVLRATGTVPRKHPGDKTNMAAYFAQQDRWSRLHHQELLARGKGGRLRSILWRLAWSLIDFFVVQPRQIYTVYKCIRNARRPMGPENRP